MAASPVPGVEYTRLVDADEDEEPFVVPPSNKDASFWASLMFAAGASSRSDDAFAPPTDHGFAPMERAGAPPSSFWDQAHECFGLLDCFDATHYVEADESDDSSRALDYDESKARRRRPTRSQPIPEDGELI